MSGLEGVSVEIDDCSGFCFGVTTAIRKAEEVLDGGQPLYCLGDIVHNSSEVARLGQRGLKTINHADFATLRGVKVLLRAHGEPPSTYVTARSNGIEIIDATCPVVLTLQRRIKQMYDTAGADTQIVIYGQAGHAEVNGLVGQTAGEAIVVEGPEDLDRIDFGRNVALYSQTTKSIEGFNQIAAEIQGRMRDGACLTTFDTICRQVAGRVGHLKDFAAAHDTVIFVSGAKSSNGHVLFEHCRGVNPDTYIITSASEVSPRWLRPGASIGICGATSTPSWLMEQVRDRIFELCRRS